MSTVFESFHRGLLQVHGELRDGASTIESAATGAIDRPVAPLVARFCERLLNHHRAEDRFFFPAFRAAGKLRSSDVAFLEARDAEHADIHRLCLELRGHRRRETIAAVVRDLAALSAPHFAAEEAALTPGHLASLISAPALGHVFRDMGRNWNRA